MNKEVNVGKARKTESVIKKNCACCEKELLAGKEIRVTKSPIYSYSS